MDTIQIGSIVRIRATGLTGTVSNYVPGVDSTDATLWVTFDAGLDEHRRAVSRAAWFTESEVEPHDGDDSNGTDDTTRALHVLASELSPHDVNVLLRALLRDEACPRGYRVAAKKLERRGLVHLCDVRPMVGVSVMVATATDAGRAFAAWMVRA